MLRERILKTKEQRRKQIKSPGDSSSPGTSSSSSANQVLKPVSNSTGQKEADTSSGTGTGGKSGAGGGVTKKVLRIVKDKSGKIISKKVWWYDFLLMAILFTGIINPYISFQWYSSLSHYFNFSSSIITTSSHIFLLSVGCTIKRSR